MCGPDPGASASSTGTGEAPLPTARPCASCPYRRDVPAGVWDASEYAKLPAYDGETHEQPTQVFVCHQTNGRYCSGWVATIDVDESLAVRFATMTGELTPEQVDALHEYVCEVPLFDSGAEAARHGMSGVAAPDEDAQAVMAKIKRLRAARGTPVTERESVAATNPDLA